MLLLLDLDLAHRGHRRDVVGHVEFERLHLPRRRRKAAIVAARIDGRRTAAVVGSDAERRRDRAALGGFGARHDRGQRTRVGLGRALGVGLGRFFVRWRFGLGNQHRLRFRRARFDFGALGGSGRTRRGPVALGGSDDVFDRVAGRRASRRWSWAGVAPTLGRFGLGLRLDGRFWRGLGLRPRSQKPVEESAERPVRRPCRRYWPRWLPARPGGCSLRAAGDG